MHVSRICAWGTSRLAFDGSGSVLRGREADLGSYSVCQFRTGKIYNCDLNASYNIGARYYIRELLKSVPAKVRLALEAKVPQAARRSTCTLSVLSIYMFTCENGYNEKEMFSDMNLAIYIAMLEEKCKRAHDHVVYMEEYRTAKEYLKNITTDGDCIIIEGKKRN